MDIEKILNMMPLEDKIALCSGASFWETKQYEKYDIPSLFMCDGPHGLRKQDQTSDNLGINDSIKAVCFPAGCATASSFDRDLVRKMGEALGNECQAEDFLCSHIALSYSAHGFIAGRLFIGFEPTHRSPVRLNGFIHQDVWRNRTSRFFTIDRQMVSHIGTAPMFAV